MKFETCSDYDPRATSQTLPAFLTVWPAGQTLLLASDGAWRHLPPEVISTIYAARPKLHDFVLTLAAVVLAGPADDNLTLMASRPLRNTDEINPKSVIGADEMTQDHEADGDARNPRCTG